MSRTRNCKRCNKPKALCKCGRPTVLTPVVLQKLEEVFSIGGTDKEACCYAGISESTLYSYQDKNQEFLERKEALKSRPILKARQTVVQSLDDPAMAFRYLERKRPEEFSLKQKIEHSGKLESGDMDAHDPRAIELAREYEVKLKELIIADIRSGKRTSRVSDQYPNGSRTNTTPAQQGGV